LHLSLIDFGESSPVTVGFNNTFEAETVDGGVRDNIYMPITNNILPFKNGALVKLTERRFPRIIIPISE